MRFVKLGSLIVVVLFLVAAGVSYSWTFTPIGRLEYRAAVFLTLAEWDDAPIELTEARRRAANEMARGRIPARRG